MLHHLRPGAQPPGRAADQPAKGRCHVMMQRRMPLPHHGAQCAEALLARRYPAPQLPVPDRHRLGLRSLDRQAQIAPAILLRNAEIAVLDVEAADQQAGVVGDRHLLVIADQIAGRPPRPEPPEMRAGLDQGGKEAVGRLARSERIDHQRHGNAPCARRDQRVAHQCPALVGGEDIIIEFQAAARAIDQGDQRVAKRHAPRDEAQMIARQRGMDIRCAAGACAGGRDGLCGRHICFMPLPERSGHGFMAFSLTL